MPDWKLEAIGRLEMGHVRRITMEFSEPFWLGDDFQGGFVLGGAGAFPVWWTYGASALVGWAGGPPADALGGLDDAQLEAAAVASLARIFRLGAAEVRERLRGFRQHDWTGDPFARGAYSYPGLGGLAAAGRLAEPVDGRLFFAGEATDSRGHYGTVHAALESGQRAAREILASRA